jgi:LEA14-like dessication related protein
LYPNPANETLNIFSNSELSEVKIYNTLGQLVTKQNATSNQTSINVSNLNKGVYIVAVQIGNESIRKQFIKE